MNDFQLDKSKVSYSYYNIRTPLIRPSKLTYNNGNGKELSDGYARTLLLNVHMHVCSAT